MKRYIEVHRYIVQTSFLLMMLLIGATVYLTSTSLTRIYGTGGDPVLISSDLALEQGSFAPTYGEITQNLQIEPQIVDRDLSRAGNAAQVSASDSGDVLAATNVAGCQDLNSQGCNSETISPQPVCTRIDASVDLQGATGIQNGDSVSVNKNAVLEVWKVTAPLAVLSGIENTGDSSQAITRTQPNFRSAGDMIDPDLIAGAISAPGDDRERIDAIVASADKLDFSVNVEAALSAQSAGTSDEATFFKELESKCEAIQPSDPNPDVSNKIGAGIGNVTRAPGDPLQPRDYEQEDCVYIDPREVDLPKSEVFEACVNRRSAFDGIIGLQLTLSQWAECSVDPAACEEVEIVGLIIDAIFGSNRVCNEGFCADQYFDQEYSSRLSPLGVDQVRDASIEGNRETLLQPHYVTTPCQIRVDKRNIYNIPCLWDVSPYWTQYQLEVAQSDPANDEIPTWEEYWSSVEQLAEARGEACSF